ncbi:glycosyltransferase family 2 protein [Paracoccus aerodenitrificans]|uniref:glycosyltransferase family 2 protein n=1 Tax=Paracoccus aerodenitrificans TaxID=3017781 RepID=UPI0022F131E6|nr:glycosyltransferase [Paracoccus aerodenitrificans]WBU63490.1 glycosyltransferase [Paracoccus aerodenitrificans]
MSSSFLLSVVIPNRNRARPLLRSVLSILDQSEDRIEIIVVDDCSETDLSSEYGFLESKGVKILRQTRHLRGAAARNRGASEAAGTHISFLDSDDMWLSGRYDEIRSFYADPAHMHSVLIGRSVLHLDGEIRPSIQPVWKKGSSLVEYAYRDRGRIQTSMLAMSTEIARKYPFDETLRVNQDTDLAMRMDRAGIGFVVAAVTSLVKEETRDSHRLTMGRETADLSYAWFKRESHDWSAAAKSGYHLEDRVWRLADSGRRGAALLSLLRTLFPPVSVRESARRGVSLALGERGYSRLKQGISMLKGAGRTEEKFGQGYLDRWQRLSREADAICASVRSGDVGGASGPISRSRVVLGRKGR